MVNFWFFFGTILILNALAATSIAIYISRKYVASSRLYMILMLAALAIWSFAYAMITFSSSLADKIFWLKIENIGIAAQAPLWFIWTFNYSFQSRSLSRWHMTFLFIIPVITLYFLFSNTWFTLYYSAVHMISENNGPLAIERGPWYWMALTQSYALNGIATVILIWRFLESRNIFRKQVSFLVLASLIPWIINIIYQLLTNLAPSFVIPIDLTPISFTMSAGLIGTSVLRTRLMELVPIARDIVMDHIPELVFVVDAHDRILDANLAMEKWLEKSKDEIIGRDPLEVFRLWPQMLNRILFSSEKTRQEIEIPGVPPTTLELVVTPIRDTQTNQLNGRVIVAHDITERKQLENNLNQLTKKLLEQATRDPLTGVFNRRFLAETLDKEISKAARENTSISVVMMDVDYFKKFNDTYGHKCGDAVLQDLANFLTKNSRQGDIVCRYGGEEFAILMPSATKNDAFERAETWRREYNSKILLFEGKELSITFSAGVAMHSINELEGEAILHAADFALYQSKSNGRNQVTLYKPVESKHAN